MRRIPLTQGREAIVDDDDYGRLAQYRWHFHRMRPGRSEGYAARSVVLPSGRIVRVLMHRVILDVQPDAQIDHINGDGLDNRKSNLRVCSQSENVYNKASHRHTTSRFKGVSWDKRSGKWHATIGTGFRKQHLGFFTDEIEAARAYNRAAIERFGEYARLNEV